MANNIGIANAILAIKSDAQVSVNAEDINSIIWHDDNPTSITNDQIIAKQEELQALYMEVKQQRNINEDHQKLNGQLRTENSNLKQQIKQLEEEAEEMLNYP